MENNIVNFKADDFLNLKQMQKDIKLACLCVKILSFLNFITFGIYKDRFDYQKEIVFNIINDAIKNNYYRK